MRVFLLAVGLSVALSATEAASPSTAEARCSFAKARIDRISKQHARGAVRCIINKKRGPNLRPHDKLHEAARDHTSYMRNRRCFSHQCSGEPSLYERIRRTGYFNGASSYRYGEVLVSAADRSSPRKLVRLWMNSSSHRATLLSTGFEHIGLALSVRNGTVLATGDVGARSG